MMVFFCQSRRTAVFAQLNLFCGPHSVFCGQAEFYRYIQTY
jgi:hypothetical protein